MDTWLIANILRLRRTLRRREGWTRERLLGHQRHELAALRAFAAERSPFYRRVHHGLGAAPLAELPVLTKATMMGHFAEIVTDPTLRLAGLQTYLEQLHGNEPFAGRYWVSATSGSSGRKSVIPSGAHQWAMTIASYSRANEWSGIHASPLHPVRMAVVSSTTAWHQSSRVAATVRSPFIHSERMDAAAPLPDIAARLNQLRPDGLPFRLLESIDGRTDDIVMLPASAGGSIRIHPVVFHHVLDLLDAPAWQVRQHGPDITVLVAAPGPQAGLTATEEAVRAALAAAGAQPRAISLSVADTIPAGAAGKRPLAVADRATGHI